MTRVWKNFRILVLAPDLPYPCIGGGRTRMASILDALGSLATVRVAARAAVIPPETEAWCGERNCHITAIDAGRGSLYRRMMIRVRTLVSGDRQGWDPTERRQLDEAFAAFRPHLVWVEASYQVKYALRWRDRAAVVVDFWGTSEGAQRILSGMRGLGWIWQRYHCAMARRNEARQVPLLSAAVTVSDHVAANLRTLAPSAPVITVPAALTGPDRDRRIARERVADTIVLSGVMSFQPNIDAACWFVNDILPIVRKSVPAARVVLAGAMPSSAVRALAVPGVIDVTGSVPDLRDLCAAATVYALPMRLGSGIRTKLLDVFPTGTPLVTTTVGAEGFNLRHGENALVADDAASFAAACVRLLADGALATKIGSAARRLALEVHTQENVRRRVAEVLEHCLGAAGKDLS